MKKNNKAFVMAEIIIVSTVVIGALIIIYSQFVSIINSYNKSFKYNNVEDLYSANNIGTFIKSNGMNILIEKLNTTSHVDITNCASEYFTEYFYCQGLFKNLDVKTVLFAQEDINELKKELTINNIYSEDMFKFIKSIKPKKEENYRLIIEFNDKTFATIKLTDSNYLVSYQIGDLVSIKVNDYESYDFNIIRNSAENDENVWAIYSGINYNKGLWLSQSDCFIIPGATNEQCNQTLGGTGYVGYGPRTALKRIDSITQNWLNTNVFSYTIEENYKNYTNDTLPYEHFKVENVRGRLISMEDFVIIGAYSNPPHKYNTIPWLASASDGVITSFSDDTDIYAWVWHFHNDGRLCSTNDGSGSFLKPVINISKKYVTKVD